jgi:hypothetical protein
MPLSQDHGRVWKKITDVYQQWDQDRSNLMAIDDLSQRLPDIDPKLIAQTLAQAHAEGMASASHEEGVFRPVPNH